MVSGDNKYKSVMLIDDNEIDNFLNEKVISENKFANHIHINSSGVNALEYLSDLPSGESKPDVIFIDINMPIMDGFQFLNRLLNLDKVSFDDVKLVILTSSFHPLDIEKTKNYKREIMFFNKPLTRATLEAI